MLTEYDKAAGRAKALSAVQGRKGKFLSVQRGTPNRVTLLAEGADSESDDDFADAQDHSAASQSDPLHETASSTTPTGRLVSATGPPSRIATGSKRSSKSHTSATESSVDDALRRAQQAFRESTATPPKQHVASGNISRHIEITL